MLGYYTQLDTGTDQAAYGMLAAAVRGQLLNEVNAGRLSQADVNQARAMLNGPAGMALPAIHRQFFLDLVSEVEASLPPSLSGLTDVGLGNIFDSIFSAVKWVGTTIYSGAKAIVGAGSSVAKGAQDLASAVNKIAGDVQGSANKLQAASQGAANALAPSQVSAFFSTDLVKGALYAVVGVALFTLLTGGLRSKRA